MKITSANDLQERIIKVAGELDCKNIQLAKQGKASDEIANDLFEMMFIHEFLPYWNTGQVRQKECLLNEKYNV